MKKIVFILASLLTFTSTAFAQLGQLATDLVYTPVTPCRLFDTRPSQGGTGPIAAAGTKHFRIWGQSSYAVQGGSPTNCGITASSSTAAVALNVTVVTPAAGGFVTAFPFGAALPTAATVNFQAGDIARGNFTIAKVDQSGAAATDLSVYSSSLADVVGDVVGYFSRPISTGSLECVDTAANSSAMTSGPIAGLYYSTVAAPACAAGYVVTALYCNVDNIRGSANPWSAPNTSTCVGNSPTNTENVRAWQRCCRIPGR